MTEIQEQRIKRDAQILVLLQHYPLDSYETVAAKCRVSRDVVVRVAKQNDVHRTTGRKKQAVTRG